MQRLSPAEHSGQRLYRYPSDVYQRLLHSERYACRLGVKPQLHGARIFRTETFLHCPCPYDTSCTILCDLLEKVIMCIKEKRKPRDKFINVHSAIDAVLYILDTVAESECQLL